MSLLYKETPESGEPGDIFRLGDAWIHNPGPPTDFDNIKWEPEDSADSPAPLLRLFNQARKKEYQSNVTETNIGSPRCIHCKGESKTRERKQEKVEQSRDLAKSSRKANNCIYEPLPSASAIRVLQLKPASTYDTPLRANLVVHSNRENTRYVALSYTWSGVAQVGMLDLGVGSLEITGNLNLALRALRLKDATLRIWIDAVCIDQENLAEKALQVGAMDETYDKAESVLAWLGPSTENTSAALKSMETIAELSKRPEYDQYTAPRPIALEDWLFPMNGDVATQIRGLRASTHIDDIIKRAWFTRLWIVQEVILAKDIVLHLGLESMTWQQFCRAVKMLWVADSQFISNSLESAAGNDPIMHAVTLIDSRDKFKSTSMGNMLMRDYTLQVFGKTFDLSKWGCQDERDRVFAILGFVPKDSDIRIVPDYTVDAREVYIHFAREHILHEGLMILLYTGLERRSGVGLLEFAKQSSNSNDMNDPDLEKLGLPSWVPDLRPDHTSALNRYWNPMNFMAAMDRAPAVVLHTSCHHVLAVKGCIFDTISQPLPAQLTRPGKTGIMDFLEAIIYLGFVYRFAKDHYEKRGGYPMGEDFETVFDSVVTVGKTTTKLKRVAQDREPDWIDSNLELLKRGSENNFQTIRDMLTQSPNNVMDIGVFFSSLSLLFLNDMCILTEEGFMGIAPNCSRLDKIAWINELQSLVILRPVIEGQQYQLIGPCFLHGLMNGELAAMGSDEETCTFLELI